MKFYTECFRRGNLIYYSMYEDGKKLHRKVKYEPTLYVRNDGDVESPFNSIDNINLKDITFNSMSEARDWIKANDNIDNLKDREYWGSEKWVYNFLNETFPNEVKFDRNQLRIANIDIETKSGSKSVVPDPYKAEFEITAITVEFRRTFYVFHFCDYKKHRDDIIQIKCSDEIDLISKFLRFWKNMAFDIVTGWYIELFDIPYIYNRIKHLLGEEIAKRLSPFGIIGEREVEVYKDKFKTVYRLYGVAILDYRRLYIEFSGKTQESYKLNHISYVELKEKKLDYSDYESLDDLYSKNPQLFIEYNIQDVELVTRLEEKLTLIDLALTIAYTAKINIEDCFTSVLLWDIIIHNHMMDNGMIVNKYASGRKDAKYKGAFVKDPVIGAHGWVTSFDVKSLYPSLMVQYNMSPDTFVKKLSNYPYVLNLLDSGLPDISEVGDYAVAMNGTCWRRDKIGIFPELILLITEKRDYWKKIMQSAERKVEAAKIAGDSSEQAIQAAEANRANIMQLAFKVILNSLYGAIGNSSFRWYQVDFAEAITISGQYYIQYVGQSLEDYMIKMVGPGKYWIATDTDSVYLQLTPMIKKYCNDKSKDEIITFIDKVCKQRLEVVINNNFQEIADSSNAYKQFLKMKREVIAERGIWRKKKNYALLVWDNEGNRLSEPYIKAVGLEVVKSSTPEICRTRMKEALKIFLSGTEDQLVDLVESFREEFKTYPIEDISSAKTCSNVDKYYDEVHLYSGGTPIHSRGALVYNKLLLDNGLEMKYERISDGSKIKYCYMKMPNPAHENVISIVDVLPKQLGLDQFVDYDKQFNATFHSPIKTICDVIGWKSEDSASLF